MVATIRKRSREESAITDTTCTPLWLTTMLPYVDIDPCSNSRSTVNAGWSFSLEKGLDGTKLPWRGTVFKNWPFSAPLPFALKAIHEMSIGNCLDLITLCKLDTSTEWWTSITSFDASHEQRILRYPPEMWLFKDRVQYDEHPDIIEERRLERVLEAQRKGKKQRSIDKITGKSTTNFVSAILHRRGWTRPASGWMRRPRLKLESVATLWEHDSVVY